MNDVQIFASTPQIGETDGQIDYILLDGSSSMSGQWFDVLDAIDAYVDGVKAAGAQTVVKVATFDSTDLNCIQRDDDIKAWVPFKTSPIGSYGGTTPLYDAIALMGRQLRDLNPPRASIVIATDGDENGSRYTDVVQAQAIIKWMEAKGWQVTFIGCDWNNGTLADKLGVNKSAAIGVSKARLTDAARELSKKRARYGASGAPMHWSDDEKQQFGGYLANPNK